MPLIIPLILTLISLRNPSIQRLPALPLSPTNVPRPCRVLHARPRHKAVGQAPSTPSPRRTIFRTVFDSMRGEVWGEASKKRESKKVPNVIGREPAAPTSCVPFQILRKAAVSAACKDQCFPTSRASLHDRHAAHQHQRQPLAMGVAAAWVLAGRGEKWQHAQPPHHAPSSLPWLSSDEESPQTGRTGKFRERNRHCPFRRV